MVARLLDDRLDMVVGVARPPRRVPTGPATASATGCSRRSSGCCSARAFTDMLSGYRVFSRRFVKSFPGLSRGFEIETELTVHALELRVPMAEVETPYYARPQGSTSKLSTWRDGLRILRTIVRLAQLRTPARVLLRDRHCARAMLDRARQCRLHHLHRDRPGAALPDRDPVDRADAAGASCRSPADSSSTPSRADGAR